ncbi:MAG: NAD(P)/FAD-dependent oxidoreductase [Bacilli bacterium]|nr:NAD(P)/FAD-dependent oxidoreductase [Bacilli bacterium]MBO4682648.1 NAD(P)/FAD-dependent oxidoreductase [Bacilli bacterium]
MNKKKKIIIVGGGISGLAAGIFAIQQGFEPLILEKNPVLGGLCTGWKRKGFNLDGCIHWITGTKKGTQLYDMWKSIGAFEDDEIYHNKGWGTVDYEGTPVPFWSDLDKTQEEWIRISPEDTKRIKRFFKTVKAYIDVELPTEAPTAYLSYKTALKFVFKLVKYFPHYEYGLFASCDRYAKKFKSPALRYAITHIQPGKGNLYSMIFSYANVASGNGGNIKGGSLKFVENIKKKYESLGGEYLLNSPVKKVNFKHRRAIGVTLEDGTLINGDYVVTCCDANYVLMKILKGRFPVFRLARRFNRPKKHPAPSCVLLHFAVQDMVDVDSPYNFSIEPFSIGGYKVDHINMRSLGHDPMYVKGNTTVVQVMIDQYSKHYDYWANLYQHKDFYNVVKEAVAKMVSINIEKKFPSLSGKITLLDVATPVTFNRYVNASRGTYMGFLYTSRSSALMFSGKVPFLRKIYLSGQYVQCPGGLPLAMVAGNHSIQRIRYKENTLFKRYFIRNRMKAKENKQ